MAVFQSLRNKITKFSLLTWLLIAGALWLIAAIILWWNIVYTNPEKVFEGMLKNNFSTNGYTREVTSSPQPGVKATEFSQVQTGKKNLVHSITNLKQGRDSIKTETISTVEQEFVRYLSIETDQKGSNGKKQDYSSAVNVWAKGENNSGSSQALTQMVFGIMPIGFVNAGERDRLLSFIKTHNVFSVNYDTVKKTKVNGRTVYTYQVQLLPQPYIEMLKKYGEAVGYGERVANLNPSDYANEPPSNLEISVDVVSRQMKTLILKGEGQTEVRKEIFSGYGIIKPVELPQKTISTQDLQKRLAPQ